MHKAAATASATLVRESPDWGAPASLYRLSPPLSGFEHVVVATSDCGESAHKSIRPKLRVFGCEPNGDINSYRELAEPIWAGCGHVKALARCGYAVTM